MRGEIDEKAPNPPKAKAQRRVVALGHFWLWRRRAKVRAKVREEGGCHCIFILALSTLPTPTSHPTLGWEAGRGGKWPHYNLYSLPSSFTPQASRKGGEEGVRGRRVGEAA